MMNRLKDGLDTENPAAVSDAPDFLLKGKNRICIQSNKKFIIAIWSRITGASLSEWQMRSYQAANHFWHLQDFRDQTHREAFETTQRA